MGRVMENVKNSNRLAKGQNYKFYAFISYFCKEFTKLEHIIHDY